MPVVGATSLNLHDGMVLGARYELKVQLGEGGMGVVWKALDLKVRSEVAVKFPKHTDSASVERFAAELRAMGRLVSPHAVRVLDCGAHADVPFFVMEYLEGRTLHETLLFRGRLEPVEVLSIVEQVADCLSEAHELGFVHRDLKPSNVFLLGERRPPWVKVLDFGVAKLESSGSTVAGTFLGSPHYVSPEQARDASRVDGRADVWALGVVAFECLTGRRPFEGSSTTGVISAILEARLPVPSEINPLLSQTIDDFFADALSPDASRRPSDPQALARRLRSALGETGEPVRRADESTESTHRPHVSSRLNQRVRLAATIGVPAAVAIGFWLGRSLFTEPSVPLAPPETSITSLLDGTSQKSHLQPPPAATGPQPPPGGEQPPWLQKGDGSLSESASLGSTPRPAAHRGSDRTPTTPKSREAEPHPSGPETSQGDVWDQRL